MKLTRTFITTTATIKYYDIDADALRDDIITFSGEYSEKVERGIRRKLEESRQILCSVTPQESTPAVWELEESEFLKYAHPLDKRNSAVKLVTRNIKSTQVRVTYFDKATGKLEQELTTIGGKMGADAERQLRKAYSDENRVYCKAEKVQGVNGIYALDEMEFLKHAKPCTTRTIDK